MLQKEVYELISEVANCGVEEISSHIDLAKDLGLDSIDSVELLMKLEHRFNISISDEDAERVRTCGDAVKLIESKVG